MAEVKTINHEGVVIKNGFTRNDGIVSKGIDCSNPIVRNWIHKDVIVKTGEGEDDWLIDQKPVLVDEYDIQKEIDEQAKGLDVKTIVQNCIKAGENPEMFALKQGEGVDITGMPSDMITAQALLQQSKQTLSELPDDLKGKGADGIASMSREEFENYIAEILAKQSQAKVEPEQGQEGESK